MGASIQVVRATMGSYAPRAWTQDSRVEEMSRALVMLVALVSALLGCPKAQPTPTLPLIVSDDPVASSELDEAQEREAAGDDEGAVLRYRAFLQAHAEDPLAAVASLRLGRLLLARGEFAESRDLFAKVSTHPDESVAERGRFFLGVTSHLEGRHADAVEALRPLRGRTIAPEDTSLLYRTLGAAYERLGERALAVDAYNALVEEAAPEDDKAEVRGRIGVLVREATVDELGVMRSALPRTGEAWPIVAVRSLREAYESGDLETVRSVALELADADVELEPELRAMTLRADRTGQADPRAIGAILPLSGRGREVGQLALQAMMLGASLPPGSPPGPDSPRIFFRDSAGDATRAEAAVNDLVTVHRVTAIVGPPDTESSRAAARRAEELGVPYISLAPDAEMTAIGAHVFRLLPTFTEELRALVLAAQSSGGSRIAILRPSNGFGQRAHRALTAVLEGMGLTLAADVEYDPSATSFREPMTALRGHDFDTLLIPDGASRIALIAPALAAAGLWSSADGTVPSRARDARAVRLLLPSVAFSTASAMRSSHRYLQGAFVSRTYDAALSDESQEFATLFEEQYGRLPSLFAAVAFDALALALQASRQGGDAGRAATRSSLEGQAALAPVTSLGGFSGERTPLRGPEVLMFQADALVPRI